MSERAQGEAGAQERGETGGKSRRTQRWTQSCVRQASHREPKMWVKSDSAIPPKACRTQNSPENAARERSRVKNLRQAFHSLQAALPSVPPDTKLSKLDVLVLATNYIAHLTETLDQGESWRTTASDPEQKDPCTLSRNGPCALFSTVGPWEDD